MSEFIPLPKNVVSEEKYLAWVKEIQTRIARLSAGYPVAGLRIKHESGVAMGSK